MIALPIWAIELAVQAARLGFRALLREIGPKRFRLATEIAARLVDEANRVLDGQPGAEKMAWVLERLGEEPAFEAIAPRKRKRLVKLVEASIPEDADEEQSALESQPLPVVQMSGEALRAVGLFTLADELEGSV